MINEKKLEEYVTTMLANVKEAGETADFALTQIFVGEVGTISERTLHRSFKFIIAKEKKLIEENSSLAQEQKEEEKDKAEFLINQFEETLKSSLKQQGRLI